MIDDKLNQLAKMQAKQQQPVPTSPPKTDVDPRTQQLAQQQFTPQNTLQVQTDENGRRYMPTLQALQYLSGQNQQAYQNRQSEKQYNNSLALNFSERYGVPITPKSSIENLFAQVKGIKPLNIEERDYQRSWNTDQRTYQRDRDQEMDTRYYDERDYGRTWNEDERTYKRGNETDQKESMAYTGKIISRIMSEARDLDDVYAMIGEMGEEMANRGIDPSYILKVAETRFPAQGNPSSDSRKEAVNAAMKDPRWEDLKTDREREDLIRFYDNQINPR